MKQSSALKIKNHAVKKIFFHFTIQYIALIVRSQYTGCAWEKTLKFRMLPLMKRNIWCFSATNATIQRVVLQNQNAENAIMKRDTCRK